MEWILLLLLLLVLLIDIDIDIEEGRQNVTRGDDPSQRRYVSTKRFEVRRCQGDVGDLMGTGSGNQILRQIIIMWMSER